jgi:hypothetical protein
LGEGHVALEDAGPHARTRLMALLSVLGELQRPAPAVADGEVSLVKEWAVRTLLEFFLEPTGFHFVDEVERPRAQLDVRATACVRVIVSKAIGCRAHRDSREEGKDGGDSQSFHTLLHKRSFQFGVVTRLKYSCVWDLSKLLWRPDEETINSRQSPGEVLMSP